MERKLKEDALAEKQKRENQAYMENGGILLGDFSMNSSGKLSSFSPSNAEAILTKHYGFDEATIAKVKRISKPYARKIQILTVLEQRAAVQGKTTQSRLAKQAKVSLKRKHDATKKGKK